jgi:2-keto-4-pentenoate hydratase/2-oxohepta-3-ene-1,7-dioic acid hydratase in catechol pathway
MRYGRILHDGAPRWVRVDDGELKLLRDSPIEQAPWVAGSVPFHDVVWLPPIMPSVFYAVGMNYRDHIEHAIASGNTSATMPDRPEVGYRANNALIGHGHAVLVPPDVRGRFEAEPEIVAVIGRRLRHASRAEAQEAVFGWTIGNDVSAREWQRSDRTFWRSKNCDTFKPMGPWIETDLDLDKAETIVRVNGEEADHFRTNNMIHGVAKFLSRMSQYLTLYPGDVVWMGTDGWPRNLKHGDVCEIEITGIGILRNPIEREGM